MKPPFSIIASVVCLSMLLAACASAPTDTPVAVLPATTSTATAFATPTLTPTAMPTSTTNYDELLEDALRTRGIGYHRIVSDKGIGFWSEDELQLVKMHGSVDDEESIVVTEDDYAKYSRQHPNIRRRLADLLAIKTFLFIGYSLSDPDFNFIYDEIRFDLEGHKRYAYSVQLKAEPLEVDNWKRKHVHVINLDKPEDVTAFLRELSA